jgi:hypothetical protein
VSARIQSCLDALFSNNFGWLAAASVFAILAIFLWINDFLYGPDPVSKIRKRLAAYVLMSTAGNATPAGQSGKLLSTEEHAILLGILKKIEQKSSILTTIIVFLQSAFLAAYFQEGLIWTTEDRIIAWAAACIFPAFVAAFFGMRHIDLGHTSSESFSTTLEHSEYLQLSLIEDLIQKERWFKFSWYILIIVSTCLFLMLGTKLIVEISSASIERI